MDVVKGLKPAIAAFNHSEKNLINQVAERVKENGFPLDAVTQVYLKKRINNQREYYADNTVVFRINPAVYKFSQQGATLAQIDTRWEDSTTVYHPDGSVDFFLNPKKDVDLLVLTLYGLQDNYNSERPIDAPSKIVSNINEVFSSKRITELNTEPKKRLFSEKEIDESIIQEAISRDIAEITQTHMVEIHETENNEEYYVVINPFMSNFSEIQSDYSTNKVDVCLRLKVNLVTREITLAEYFYPGFYETPISEPEIDFQEAVNND